MWVGTLSRIMGESQWQQTLKDAIEAREVAYQNVVDEFHSVLCAESRIVTRSNLMDTSKVKPQVGVIS